QQPGQQSRAGAHGIRGLGRAGRESPQCAARHWTKVQLKEWAQMGTLLAHVQRRLAGLRCSPFDRPLPGASGRKPGVAAGLGFLLSLLPIVPAAASDSDHELATKLNNPVASLISVPFQFNYDCCTGITDARHITLNIQPVIPFALND